MFYKDAKGIEIVEIENTQPKAASRTNFYKSSILFYDRMPF